jgi:regulator of cell morphogenesis and NO signaling
MDITSETRIGHIATTVPGSIEVFERYGVDFCCGGDVPLAEALRGTGLSVGAILAEIEAAAASLEAEDRLHEDWSERDPSSLADHVESVHHAYLRQRLPEIGNKLATVLMVHGEAHPELFELGRLYERLRREVIAHLDSEESEVFPALRSLHLAVVGAKGEDAQLHHEGRSGAYESALTVDLQALEGEHESVGSLLKAMRGVTSNYQPPAGACATYNALYQELQAVEADVHRHIHLENNVMFPAVRRLMDDLH